MTERIFKDVAQLGSTLTQFASDQLSTMMTELRGGRGDGEPSVATLTNNVIQIVNQVGALVVELSKYDLVRKDVSVLSLSSPNSISSHTMREDEASSYTLLVENDGQEDLETTIVAELHPGGTQALEDTRTIGVAERRRFIVKIPRLPAGKRTLVVTAKVRDKVVARKTVAISILPLAKPHSV